MNLHAGRVGTDHVFGLRPGSENGLQLEIMCQLPSEMQDAIYVCFLRPLWAGAGENWSGLLPIRLYLVSYGIITMHPCWLDNCYREKCNNCYHSDVSLHLSVLCLVVGVKFCPVELGIEWQFLTRANNPYHPRCVFHL